MSKAQAAAAMRMASRQGISLKSAWAKVKGRRSGGKRMASKGKRGGSRRRGGYRAAFKRAYSRARGVLGGTKVPLTLTYIATGAAVDVFNLAPATRKSLFDGLTQTLRAAGLNYTVNGYTVGAVLVGVKLACSLSPWLHAKVNGFLSGFGMKI